MKEHNETSNPHRRSGLLLLLGLAVMLMGIAFCALLWRGYQRASAFDSWQERPAVVLASWIEALPQPGSEPPRFRFRVRYEYEIDGQKHISTNLKEIVGNTRQRSKVEALEKRYLVAATAVCFVNPEDPTDALLLRPTKAPGYTLWFPALFAVGGAGMCVVALRRSHR